MIGSVHVLGSLNLDFVARVRALPLPGETVHSQFTSRSAGGKGANQAVAAARAGSKTYMNGVVGVDDDGEFLIRELDSEGIETKFVRRHLESPTGRAYITVQDDGENSIVLVAGSNNCLTDSDAQRSAKLFNPGDVLLLQLETPINATRRAAILAQQAGLTVVLNAAPAATLPRSLVKQVDVIIANENELTTLVNETGTIPEKAHRMAARFGITVVVTLGRKGALIATKDLVKSMAAPAVTAVDTTGAGDAFVGYFASELCRGHDLYGATSVAVIAGSLTVQQAGAQSSIPRKHDVDSQYDGSTTYATRNF